MGKMKIGFIILEFIISLLLALAIVSIINLSTEQKKILELLLFYFFIIIFLLFYLRSEKVKLSKLFGGYPSISFSLRMVYYIIKLLLLFISFVGLYTGIIIYVGLPFLTSNLYGDLRILPFNLFLFDRIIKTFFVPIVEEILFRSICFHILGLKYGVRKSILFTSLIFSILHVNFVWSFLFSVVALLIYMKSASLYYPIILHMVHNGIVTLFLLFIRIKLNSKIIQSCDRGLSIIVIVSVLLIVFIIKWLLLFIKRNWPTDKCQLPYYSS